MLDENYANIEAISNAIIWVHRNKVLPNPAPPGLTLVNDDLKIDYGHFGSRNGTVVIKRGQFELTQVSDARNALQPLSNYNHAGDNDTRQKFIDALKCNNLQSNQSYVSAIIILTSECCRSSMVLSAVKAIMNGHGNFSADVWGGLKFAFTSYAHTASYMGYNINAGQSPWVSLRADDYLSYINKGSYNGDKVTAARQISAVKEYNKGAP